MTKAPESLSKIAPLILILIGVILRLKFLMNHCSLNIDEASIGVDIYARNYLYIIFNKLHYLDLPNRPVGNLIIQKLCIQFLGGEEWSLRLFPWICSIASLFIFWKISAFFLGQPARIVALALFVFNEQLIFYSASAKQYAGDVLVVLLLISMWRMMQGSKWTWASVWLHSGIGIIAVLFSHVSVFVLMTIGLTGFITSAKKPKPLQGYFRVCLIWIVTIGIIFNIYLSYMIGNESILRSAGGWISPKPFLAAHSLVWLAQSIYAVFQNPGCFYPAWLALFLFVIGLMAQFREDKLNGYILVIPILLVLVSACLRWYPFYGRYLTFVVPILIIVISKGAEWLLRRIKPSLRILRIGLIFSLLVYPISTSASNIWAYDCKQDYRTLMAFFGRHVHKNDFIYINSLSQFPFWYYGKTLDINSRLISEPLGKWNQQDLFAQRVGRIYDPLRYSPEGKPYMEVRYEIVAYDQEGAMKTKYKKHNLADRIYPVFMDDSLPIQIRNRIWLILLHSTPQNHQFLMNYFQKHGKLVDGLTINNSGIYLFELPHTE